MYGGPWSVVGGLLIAHCLFLLIFILHLKIQNMFEQLLDLVKQHGSAAITNNPDVPNDQNEAVAQTATTSIMDTLKNMVSGGGLSSITNLFHSQSSGRDVSDHPVTQNVSSDLVTNLMNKFGFSSDKASGIANSLVPTIMNKLTGKANDPNDSSFSLQGIISSLTGGGGAAGGGGGIMDKIEGLFGK